MITEQRNPRFDVIEESRARTDLASRRESKFALEGADVLKLREVLQFHCRPLVHNERVSTVPDATRSTSR